MLRRGSTRSPPYVLTGLILILLILGFNYWTLSSQNADLQQEVERLQADIKISAMKNEQSEKKNSALQDTVHELDEATDKLQKQIKEGGEQLRRKQEEIKKKEYEVTDLKNKISKLQNSLASNEKHAEEKESEIAKLQQEHSLLLTQRNDAVEAVAERDETINTMKRQLEQIQREVAAVRREQAAVADPGVVPGAMNIPNAQEKEIKKNEPVVNVNPVAPLPLNGEDGAQVVYGGAFLPPVLQVPQGMLRSPGSVVMEKPAQPGVENKQPLQPPDQLKSQNDQRVLPVPLQDNEIHHVDGFPPLPSLSLKRR